MFLAFNIIAVFLITAASAFFTLVFGRRAFDNLTGTELDDFRHPSAEYVMALIWGAIVFIVIFGTPLWVQYLIGVFAAPILALAGAAFVALLYGSFVGIDYAHRRLSAIASSNPSTMMTVGIRSLADRVFPPQEPHTDVFERETE